MRRLDTVCTLLFELEGEGRLGNVVLRSLLAGRCRGATQQLSTAKRPRRPRRSRRQPRDVSTEVCHRGVGSL